MLCVCTCTICLRRTKTNPHGSKTNPDGSKGPAAPPPNQAEPSQAKPNTEPAHLGKSPGQVKPSRTRGQAAPEKQIPQLRGPVVFFPGATRLWCASHRKPSQVASKEKLSACTTDKCLHNIYIYVCMYVCMHVCMYVYMYVYVYVYILVFISTFVYGHTCA